MRSWELYIETHESREILWEAKSFLKNAWLADLKNPSSYPLSTSSALEQIRLKFLKKQNKTHAKLPYYRRTFKKLSDLIPEKTVRIVWQDNHAETFDQALQRAGSIGRRNVSIKDGWRAFKAIERAMEHAYLFTCYGVDFLPKPKNNILHRGLDQIARLAGLEEQTPQGFSEFLDDICPCGLKNHREAVRKLESRSPRMRRPRP